MSCRSAERRFVSESTWFRVNDVTLETVMAVAVLATTASLFFLSSGAEEMVVPVALVAMGALFLGIALVRVFEHCRRNGVPLIE